MPRSFVATGRLAPTGWRLPDAYAAPTRTFPRLHIATCSDRTEWVAQGTIMQRGRRAGRNPLLPRAHRFQWWLFCSGSVGRIGTARSCESSLLPAPHWKAWSPSSSRHGTRWRCGTLACSTYRGRTKCFLGRRRALSSIAMANSSDGSVWQRRGVSLGPSEAEPQDVLQFSRCGGWESAVRPPASPAPVVRGESLPRIPTITRGPLRGARP